LRDKGVQAIERRSCLRRLFFSLLIVCFLMQISACHDRQDAVLSAPEGRIVFNRIAVVPFQRITPKESISGAVRCPFCGVILSAEKSAGSPEKIVEARFLEQLGKSHPKFSVVSKESAAEAYRRISEASPDAPLVRILRDVGKQLGAEAVVAGYVYRFREREGRPFSVRKPASVAFEIHLVRVEDGVSVWRGVFDRTQTSLMEDLLRVSSWKWVTAEELAIDGVDEALETFPGLQ
jgi:hypothetical protein